MRELLIRAATGLVYVIIILGSAQNPYSYGLMLFVFGGLAFYEFQRLRRGILNKTEPGFWSIPFLIALLLPFITESIPYYVPALITGWFLYQLRFLIGGNTDFIPMTLPHPFGYLALSLFTASFLPYSSGNGFQSWAVIGPFILIWANDTFAYLSGRLLGRHKMAPSLSPKKTWEGTIGGAIMTAFAGWGFYAWSGEMTIGFWVILGLLVSFTSTIGDLIESKMKRLAGVKDSGHLLPGHGGFFDRLDSFIYTAPIAYFWLTIYSLL